MENAVDCGDKAVATGAEYDFVAYVVDLMLMDVIEPEHVVLRRSGLTFPQRRGMTLRACFNTPPPEMSVALLAKGVDAFEAWDPTPVIAMKDVPGAIEVIRGGDVISYLGFNIALRPWVEKNGATIEKFLAAVSEADQWMRKNPKQARLSGRAGFPG